MSGIVSGEAVVLEQSPARVGSRGIAFTIDAVVQITLLLALLLGGAAVADALGGDNAIVAATALVGIVGALVGYPLIFETTTRGRSLGKLAMGLRVVRNDGGAVRFRHSLVRALFGVVELWATSGVIAIIASLSSADGRRLGDQFAGTLVIRERAPRATGRDVLWTMPPRMAPWAATADISQIPDDLALAVRTFLLRTPELRPDARWQLALTYANDVGRRVSPAPPPGVHPEEFLVGVLALRRYRDDQRRAAMQAQQRPPTH